MIPIAMLASTHISLLSDPDDLNDPAYHDDPHHHPTLFFSHPSHRPRQSHSLPTPRPSPPRYYPLCSPLAAQRPRRSQLPCISRRCPSPCYPLLIARCSAIPTIPTTLHI